MKKSSPLRMVHIPTPATPATLAALLVYQSLQAQNTLNSYTGSETGSLLTPANWSLGAVPSVTQDAVFTATTGIRSLTTGDLTVGSFNVTATAGTFSIRNNTDTSTNHTLTLGGAGNLGNSVSGTAGDLLYAASGSIFNLRGDNPNGTGVMNLVLGQSGNFNIAGTASISAILADGGNHYGFTKTGSGTLTLSGVNTYSGDTTVSSGTLVLATDAGIKFVITNTSNNRLCGSGTATLKGIFTIDTSAVTQTSGTWSLVDATALNESYDSSFSVAGFGPSPDATTWTKTEDAVPAGTKTWVFTKASGELTLTRTDGTAYDTWATSPPHNLSGDNQAFDCDYDHDGLANGLEWILGGDPTRHDSPTLRPVAAGNAATGLTLVFNRNSAALDATTLELEWGGGPNTLANRLVIGSGNRNVPPLDNSPRVYQNTPGPGMVTVVIPPANASGGKLFARLKASHQ